VIVTPCEVKLYVRTVELRAMAGRRKPKKDSRKF
jgi:hypothetical protein